MQLHHARALWLLNLAVFSVFITLAAYLVPSLLFHDALLLGVFVVAALNCHDSSAERRQALITRWYLAGLSWPRIGFISVAQVVLVWAVPLLGAAAAMQALLYPQASAPLYTVAAVFAPLLLAMAGLSALLQALLSGQGRGAALAFIVLLPLLLPLFLFAQSAALGNSAAVWFLWGQALVWLSLSPWLCGLCWKIQLQGR